DSFVAVGCAAGNCAGFNPAIVSTSGTTVPGGIGTATFNDDASVADLSISDTSEVVAPIAVSISGDYTNLGSANWNGGTTTFNGTSAQIATGTMTGASQFNNLAITNTSATTSFETAVAASSTLTVVGGAT